MSQPATTSSTSTADPSGAKKSRQDEAATKIQALQRGRATRQRQALKKAEVAASDQSLKEQQQRQQELELAAIKIQSAQRSRAARKSVEAKRSNMCREQLAQQYISEESRKRKEEEAEKAEKQAATADKKAAAPVKRPGLTGALMAKAKKISTGQESNPLDTFDEGTATSAPFAAAAPPPAPVAAVSSPDAPAPAAESQSQSPVPTSAQAQKKLIEPSFEFMLQVDSPTASPADMFEDQADRFLANRATSSRTAISHLRDIVKMCSGEVPIPRPMRVKSEDDRLNSNNNKNRTAQHVVITAQGAVSLKSSPPRTKYRPTLDAGKKRLPEEQTEADEQQGSANDSCCEQQKKSRRHVMTDREILELAVRRSVRCALRHYFLAEFDKTDAVGVSDFDDDEEDESYLCHFREAKKISRKAALSSVVVVKEFTCGKVENETLMGHVAATGNVNAIRIVFSIIAEELSEAPARELLRSTLQKFVLLQRDEEAFALLQAAPRDLASNELGAGPVDGGMHADTLLHAFCRRRRPRAQLIERLVRFMLFGGGKKPAETEGGKMVVTTPGKIRAVPTTETVTGVSPTNKEQEDAAAAAGQSKKTTTASVSVGASFIPKISVSTDHSQSSNESKSASSPPPLPQQQQQQHSKKKAAPIYHFDINGRNGDRLTPLHLVVSHSVGAEGRSTFNLLTEMGASVFMRTAPGGDMVSLCTNPFIRDILEEQLGDCGGNVASKPNIKVDRRSPTRGVGDDESAMNRTVTALPAKVRAKIDNCEDLLRLPRELMSPGGLKRKNSRIELDSDYNIKKKNADHDDEGDDHSGDDAADTKKEAVDIAATVERLYVNPKQQRSEFIAGWVKAADQRRDELIRAKFPRGRAPAKVVSGERLKSMVTHLHEETIRKKEETMARLHAEQQAAELAQKFHQPRSGLSVEEMRDMGDRLCNGSQQRKKEFVERLAAEIYKRDDPEPLDKNKIADLGKRLHDQCRDHWKKEMGKLFDTYVPPPKKIVINEDARYANMQRLTSATGKWPPSPGKQQLHQQQLRPAAATPEPRLG